MYFYLRRGVESVQQKHLLTAVSRDCRGQTMHFHYKRIVAESKNVASRLNCWCYTKQEQRPDNDARAVTSSDTRIT